MLEEFEILAADIPLSVIFEHVPVDELLLLLPSLLRSLHPLLLNQLHLLLPEKARFFEHFGLPVVVEHLERLVLNILGDDC